MLRSHATPRASPRPPDGADRPSRTDRDPAKGEFIGIRIIAHRDAGALSALRTAYGTGPSFG